MYAPCLLSAKGGPGEVWRTPKCFDEVWSQGLGFKKGFGDRFWLHNTLKSN